MGKAAEDIICIVVLVLMCFISYKIFTWEEFKFILGIIILYEFTIGATLNGILKKVGRE